jgi:hypothetical protein
MIHFATLLAIVILVWGDPAGTVEMKKPNSTEEDSSNGKYSNRTSQRDAQRCIESAEGIRGDHRLTFPLRRFISAPKTAFSNDFRRASPRSLRQIDAIP